MPGMYTQCPECLTIFKIGAAELAAAHGSVRCSHCNALFNALPSLSEQLPAEPIGRLVRHSEHVSPPQLGLPVFRPNRGAQGTLFLNPDDRPRAHERALGPPQFTRSHRRSEPTGNGIWLFGSFVLLLLLGAEIAWAERSLWINESSLRPLIVDACAKLGCQVPLRKDDELLQLASRDIRPHPSVPGALIISATLQNAGHFAQPFPVVAITLSDLDEQRIAMRRFQPREYISDPRALANGLAPDAKAPLVFEVADPGKNAVAFEFRFE
ncbi:MAG: zinc-ribbon domain-containing protein [Xanthomonadales bacterium]|nr:zinc-ribbon domain-containing protein [Xanthomonadales bacterium]